MWDHYLIAESVTDALEKLASFDGQARIIAGGTDLALQARRGTCPSRSMVDVTRIPGLDRIEEKDGWIVIGATATHAQVAASPLIRSRAAVLAQACGSVGGPQIRNVATLVGNVVNALPAADGAVGLFSLDAQVEVTALEGHQLMPISELYESVGVCTIDPCIQMVTALRFRPLSATMGGAFQRLAKRRALVLPIVNAAVVVGMQGGAFTEVRIAVGPVAPTPFRAEAAEQSLIGQATDEANVTHAAKLAANAARPRASMLRGSKAYRTAMVEVLVRRALTQAVQAAAGR
ncbi:MAG: FAD binding domain-containing protein [Anaerolineae bacterium]|nr:FAD binding domain-containing protein [Anaerolineae bacterium]